MNNNFPEPIIIDNKYCLRQQKYSDLDDFFIYFSDPRVSQYILSSIPDNLAQARDELGYWINLFNNGNGIYWAISTRDDDRMIGAIGFHDINRLNNRAEISYDLHYDYWRQGIMKKAVNLALEYAFRKMNINRVQASTIIENKASIGLLKKCNFTWDGSFRSYRYHNGKYYDIEIYSILEDEYRKIYNLKI